MPVTSADIKFYYTGGSANSDPNASLGGTGSSVEITTGLNGLFDDVAASEATSGDTEYRAIDVKNTHGSLSLYDAKIWFTGTPKTGLSFWVDTSGTVSVGNEDTEPAGASGNWSAPTSEPASQNLSAEIAAGAKVRVWIRRIVSAGVSSGTDSRTINIKGQTV